jgi:hypothetical protein
MATDSNYALRVPASLMQDVRIASARDGVSLNSFMVQAVAEKVAMLRARGLLNELTPEEQEAYLASRARRGSAAGMLEVLRKAGTTTEVRPGDEIPEGYFDKPPAQ